MSVLQTQAQSSQRQESLEGRIKKCFEMYKQIIAICDRSVFLKDFFGNCVKKQFEEVKTTSRETS